MISVPLVSLVLEEGALSSKGNSYLAFRKIRKGKRTLPVFVDSQLPSAQNNPYTKWHISGWPALAPFTLIMGTIMTEFQTANRTER